MSTDTNSGRGVVFKYYLYRAVGNPGFIRPIYVLYLLFSGLNFAQIGVIGAMQSAIVLGGEIPSGYIGDRIGRRNSLLVAQVLYTLSSVGMIFANGFLDFALSFALLAFGMTFVSGSADAWLYDTLQEHLHEDQYTHVRGRGAAIGQWIMAVTMIAGGGLYVLDRVYPFVALLVMRLVTFVVLRSMPQNAQYTSDDTETGEEGTKDEENAESYDGTEENAESQDGTLTILEALPIIREKLRAPPLRSFVAYMALFFGIVTTVEAYVQPIARDGLESSMGSFLSSVGVPEAVVLGVLYASFTVVSAIASDRASNLEAALGLRKAVLLIPIATAVLFVLPALVPLLAFPMFFVKQGSRSLLGPIVGQYLNDHIESVGRATVLSAVSMVYAVARIPFTVGSGVVADAFSPLVAVAALGATFLVGGGALFLWRPPITSGTETGAGPTKKSTSSD